MCLCCRRFLRKPNVTEASESFTSLAKHCESLELPAYAGLCWIAAARCEGSLLNSTEETACLLNSSRQFMRAELNDFNLGCQSVSGEYLQVEMFEIMNYIFFYLLLQKLGAKVRSIS